MHCRLLAFAVTGLLPATVLFAADPPERYEVRIVNAGPRTFLVAVPVPEAEKPSPPAEPAAYQMTGKLNEPGDLDDDLITPRDIEAAGPTTSETAVPAGGQMPQGGAR